MKSSLISNCSKFLSISLSFHTLYIAYDKIAMLQRSSNICSYYCTCIISHEYMFVNIYLNINITFYRSTYRSSHTSLNNVKFQSKKRQVLTASAFSHSFLLYNIDLIFPSSLFTHNIFIIKL